MEHLRFVSQPTIGVYTVVHRGTPLLKPSKIAIICTHVEQIANEAEEAAARINISRQQAVRTLNEQIDSTWADDGLPLEAKLLKLAKLIDANPDLSNQVEKVTDIIDQLGLREAVKLWHFLRPE